MEKYVIQVIAGQVWTVEVTPLTGYARFWNTDEHPNTASGKVIETTLAALQDLRETIEYAEQIIEEMQGKKE